MLTGLEHLQAVGSFLSLVPPPCFPQHASSHPDLPVCPSPDPIPQQPPLAFKCCRRKSPNHADQFGSEFMASKLSEFLKPLNIPLPLLGCFLSSFSLFQTATTFLTCSHCLATAVTSFSLINSGPLGGNYCSLLFWSTHQLTSLSVPP